MISTLKWSSSPVDSPWFTTWFLRSPLWISMFETGGIETFWSEVRSGWSQFPNFLLFYVPSCLVIGESQRSSENLSSCSLPASPKVTDADKRVHDLKKLWQANINLWPFSVWAIIPCLRRLDETGCVCSLCSLHDMWTKFWWSDGVGDSAMDSAEFNLGQATCALPTFWGCGSHCFGVSSLISVHHKKQVPTSAICRF